MLYFLVLICSCCFIGIRKNFGARPAGNSQIDHLFFLVGYTADGRCRGRVRGTKQLLFIVCWHERSRARIYSGSPSILSLVILRFVNWKSVRFWKTAQEKKMSSSDRFWFVPFVLLACRKHVFTVCVCTAVGNPFLVHLVGEVLSTKF